MPAPVEAGDLISVDYELYRVELVVHPTATSTVTPVIAQRVEEEWD